MKRIILILFMTVIYFSCTKEDVTKYCWKCADRFGNDIEAGGCNLTEQEAKASLQGKKSTIGETYYSSDFDRVCKRQ